MTRKSLPDSIRAPTLIVLAVLALAGLYLRVWGLWDYAMTPDEGLVLLISSEPTIPKIFGVAIDHPHPPLRYVLLHGMLEISENLVVLRSLAWLPGVALIPLFFAVGRRGIGTAAGLAMAALVTFTHAAMMLSQVLRSYMMLLLFVTIALWAFLAYLQQRNGRSLWTYGISMSLAVLSHYGAAVPLTVFGIVWLREVACAARPLDEAKRLTAANLVPGVLFSGALALHLSSRFVGGPRWWNSLDRGRLAAEYPDTVAEILTNGLRLFEYLFLSPAAWFVLALAMLGITVLLGPKRRTVGVLILLTVLINIALALAHKYPFGGVRQSVYLLPFIALAFGGGVQEIWDRVRSRAEVTAAARSSGRDRSHRAFATWTAAAVVCAAIFVLTAGVARAGFLRNEAGPGWGELPVKRADIRDGLAFLRDRLAAGDIVVAERQTTFYARYPGRNEPEEITDSVSRYALQGLSLYYSNQNYVFYFLPKEVMWRSLADVLRSVDVSDGATVWILSVGWPHIRSVIGSLGCGPLTVDGWSRGGVGIYGLRAGEIRAELARRSTSEIARDGMKASPTR